MSRHYLAEQLSFAGRNEEAIAHLREAVAGGNSRAGYLLGVELFNADRVPEAVEQLEAFLKTADLPYRLVPRWLEPPLDEVVTARLILAQAATMERRWPEAVEQARLVLAKAPGNAEAQLVIAESFFGQERYAEAAAQYRRVLESRPEDVHAWTNLGVSQVVEGNLDEAIASFRRAAALTPDDANIRQMLAMALMDHGDYEAAASEARRALELSPNDPALRDLVSKADAGARR